MYQILLVINIICALLMIFAVLMQQGRGAEMGSSFGRGASGSLFGSSGSANFLSRSTSLLALGFFITALSLTVIGNGGNTESILEQVETSVPVSETPVPISQPTDSDSSEVPGGLVESSTEPTESKN